MTNLYLEPISESAKEPEQKTRDAACYDVYADTCDRDVIVYSSRNIKTVQESQFDLNDNMDIVLQPGERALIPTGWRMCCDPGYRIAIYPRSGLAVKFGMSLITCVGVIDADYRDEVMVTLTNFSSLPVSVHHGDRIAQLAVERVEPVSLVVGTLPATESDRNGGFGSTGK